MTFPVTRNLAGKAFCRLKCWAVLSLYLLFEFFTFLKDFECQFWMRFTPEWDTWFVLLHQFQFDNLSNNLAPACLEFHFKCFDVHSILKNMGTCLPHWQNLCHYHFWNQINTHMVFITSAIPSHFFSCKGFVKRECYHVTPCKIPCTRVITCYIGYPLKKHISWMASMKL